DIFALGGLLYQLATGRPPYGKPETLAELRRRLYRDPAPPRSIVATSPVWLQEIILHCLEVDARDRYASAAVVAFDLANPAQVAITERGERDRVARVGARIRRWMRARRFEPAPCPPPAIDVSPTPVVLVAIASAHDDEPLS